MEQSEPSQIPRLRTALDKIKLRVDWFKTNYLQEFIFMNPIHGVRKFGAAS